MPTSPPRHSVQHTKANRLEQQRTYNQRDRTNQSFYSSGRWTKVSKWYRKNNPLCVHCKEQGRVTPAQLVDHIVEIKDGGAEYDESNLQSLCKACHNVKTFGIDRSQ